MLVTKTDMQQSSANQLLPTIMHVQEHTHTHTHACMHTSLATSCPLFCPTGSLTDIWMDGGGSWLAMISGVYAYSVCAA